MARIESQDRVVVDLAPNESDPYINYQNVSARIEELIRRNPEGVTTSATGPFKKSDSEDAINDGYDRDEIVVDGRIAYWHKKQNVTVNGMLVASRTDYEAVDSPDQPRGQLVSVLSLYGVHQGKSLEIHVTSHKSQGGASHTVQLSQPGINDKPLRFWGADVKASVAKQFGLAPAVRR